MRFKTLFSRSSLGWVAAGLLLAGALAFAYWPRPLEVDTGFAQYGPLRVVLEREAEVRAHDRYVISAPVAARVQRSERHSGDAVRRGEELITLLPVPMSALEVEQQRARLAAADAAVREARFRLQQGQAQARQAQRERLRTEDLVSRDFLSPQAAEQSRLAATAAQADIQALEARVKALEQESRALRSALLSQQRPDAAAVTLRSPVSGHILRLEHPSDGVVPAGAPLLVLGDPQRMEVMAEVLSQDAVRLRPGSPVELRGWGGADVLRGRLRTVEPFAYTKVSALGVEEKRVQVIADLDQRPPELGDGFRVEASFLLWESPRVLKIPASALFRRRGTWAVYVVQQGRARERQVRIGERNAQEAQILTGLKAGDEVLLYPGAQLSDGVRVQAAPRR